MNPEVLSISQDLVRPPPVLSLEPAVQVGLIAVLLLGMGALVVGLFGKRNPEGRAPLWTTFLVELGVVSWVLVPAYLGGWYWVGAVAVTAVAVLWEADRARAGWGSSTLPLLGLPLGMATVAAAVHPGAPGVLVPASLLALPSLGLFLRPSRAMAWPPVGALLGLGYPAFGLACLMALGLGEQGLLHVFILFAITEIQDTVAMLSGKFWGEALIFPRISPKKTRLGTVAGLAGAVATAMLAGTVLPDRPLWGTLVVGMAIGVAGLAGDLFASAIKRKAGIKDFGRAVPTMGGVLDVYDSLLFAAPFYLILCWAGI
ncbi:phosphatidate cytidylyltransferase [Gemmatimonadota bacterium]